MTKREQLQLLDRIENLERVVIAYHALLEDSLPPAYAESLDKLILDFFDSMEQVHSNLKTPFVKVEPL